MFRKVIREEILLVRFWFPANDSVELDQYTGPAVLVAVTVVNVAVTLQSGQVLLRILSGI